MNQYLDSTFDLMFAFARNQETIYRFDAMFDTKSALPDHYQLLETFILQNCQKYSS